MNEKRTWETDMSDAFDRRVRDLHEAPLSFEQVTTRARGIRRRRQAVVAGGVLAVAAVITPVAVIVAGDAGRTDGVPAAVSPSQTVTDTPPVPDDGPQVRVGHLEGDEYVRGDGVTFRLPSADYVRVDQIGVELVGYRRDDEGNGTVDVLDAPADGGVATVTDSQPAMNEYVVSASGLTIAWLTPDGELITRWSGEQVSFGSEFPESAMPVAISGGPNCYEEVDGCTVFLNLGDQSGPPIYVSSHGNKDTAVPDSQAIRDVDDTGLASVQISNTVDGSCGGLYDSSSSTLLFETCDYSVGGISPSGAHVLAAPAYRDGIGDSFVAILDRQGDEVARYAPEGGVVVSRTWEDPGHVVFTVYAQGTWSVWRMATDGEVEEVVGPQPGSDGEPPVVFFE